MSALTVRESVIIISKSLSILSNDPRPYYMVGDFFMLQQGPRFLQQGQNAVGRVGLIDDCAAISWSKIPRSFREKREKGKTRQGEKKDQVVEKREDVDHREDVDMHRAKTKMSSHSPVV